METQISTSSYSLDCRAHIQVLVCVLSSPSFINECLHSYTQHSDQMGSAGLTRIHSAMAASKNQPGPFAVFVCVVYHLLTWLVSYSPGWSPLFKLPVLRLSCSFSKSCTLTQTSDFTAHFQSPVH